MVEAYYGRDGCMRKGVRVTLLIFLVLLHSYVSVVFICELKGYLVRISQPKACDLLYPPVLL